MWGVRDRWWHMVLRECFLVNESAGSSLGGPVVRTPASTAGGRGWIPGQGNWDPKSMKQTNKNQVEHLYAKRLAQCGTPSKLIMITVYQLMNGGENLPGGFLFQLWPRPSLRQPYPLSRATSLNLSLPPLPSESKLPLPLSPVSAGCGWASDKLIHNKVLTSSEMHTPPRSIHIF